tara:strand:+ start:369 stop:707 length:339 start_codon:yes stop_codon:yes gene_type:complete
MKTDLWAPVRHTNEQSNNSETDIATKEKEKDRLKCCAYFQKHTSSWEAGQLPLTWGRGKRESESCVDVREVRKEAIGIQTKVCVPFIGLEEIDITISASFLLPLPLFLSGIS